MSLAFPGYQTMVGIAAEIPPIEPLSWSNMVEVIEISPISMTRQVHSVAYFQPVIWADQIRGKADPIVIDMTLNFTDTGTSTQFTDFFSDFTVSGDSGVLKWYAIMFASLLKQIRFAAVISKVEPSTVLDAQVKVNISLAVSGEVFYETITP